MQKDDSVDPSYEMEKLTDHAKIYSNKELAEIKDKIKKKFIEHLGRVIKAFLKFYPDEKYTKDKNTIKDQLKYYNDTIRKKILNIDSDFDNSEFNLGDIY